MLQSSLDEAKSTVMKSRKEPTASLAPGDVYLQCATTDDATKIMRAMGHRKYDGRLAKHVFRLDCSHGLNTGSCSMVILTMT